MTYLIDVQLPPRVKRWLLDQGVDGAIHLSEVKGGLRMPDSRVWEIAKDEGRTIVTKDMDYFDMSIAKGSPPKVLLIRYGNCSNAVMLQRLSNAWKEIESRLDNTDTKLVLVTKETMEIYYK